MQFLKSGKVGKIGMVRVFAHASGGAGQKSPDSDPPAGMDWDLWLGGAQMRPYTSGDGAYRKEYPNNQFGFYLPFNWRGFYDFGSSLIGDWGIHQLGPANLALRLGSPISVECLKKGEGQSPYTFPKGGTVIKWEFAARENMPPVTVYWSDTGDTYTPKGMTIDEMRAIPGTGPTIEQGAGGASIPRGKNEHRPVRTPGDLAGKRLVGVKCFPSAGCVTDDNGLLVDRVGEAKTIGRPDGHRWLLFDAGDLLDRFACEIEHAQGR